MITAKLLTETQEVRAIEFGGEVAAMVIGEGDKAKEVAALIAAAPELLALVRAYRTTYPLDVYTDKADTLID